MPAPNSITIRAATDDDLPTLARLYLDCRLEFSWVEDHVARAEDFMPLIAGERVDVAEVDGVIAGFIGVYAEKQFIHHLYIAQPFRRQGIGAALLDSIEAWLPRPFRLKCVEANAEALTFYRSRGWVAIRRNSDGADGPDLLMELP